MRAGAAALTGGALALASAGATSPAFAESGGVAVHSQVDSAEEHREVTSYWTPERMESAIPMDRLLDRDAREVRVAAVEKGIPEVIKATKPALLDDILPLDFPESGGPWTGGGEVVQTTGRVFFNFDGQPASCSGSAVTSANESVVITAGHCVKYEGSWHTDWVFVPGYDNGERPYGTWSAAQTLTTPQWEASEDLNYDIGAAVVNPLDGRTLTDVVGGQGIAFNQERNQDMYSFGYPAADPYDGESLIYCSGSTITDPLLSDDHGLACDMTGGSSGGPWFLDFDESSGTGALASVNSFGYVFLPGYMFGPYFGDEAQDLYEAAESL